MFSSEDPSRNTSDVPFQNNTQTPAPASPSASPLNLAEQAQIGTVNQNFLQFAQSIGKFQVALNKLINNV